jgi:MFS transporter, PAT family, beta-lactamase induction signal transducer AmpG
LYSQKDLLRTTRGRNVLFTSLYFSEGAPIGFIWWALPTLLRAEGVSITSITALTAMLVLPWTFKFLWAPLVDSFRTKNFGFKAWIISAQIFMGIFLIPLIFINPFESFTLFAALLFLHSFSASIQDVSIDALAINSVSVNERGSINGYMQAGMLLGRSLLGGGALAVSGFLGWNWIFIFLIMFTWISLLLVLFTNEPEERAGKKEGLENFKINLKEAVKTKTTWYGILFALTAAAAFEAVGGMAGPFLIDYKNSTEMIGFFFGIPVVIAAIIGGLIGGKISDKISRKKAVLFFLIGFVSIISLLGVADIFYPEILFKSFVPILLLTLMYFFIGLFTASSYALFMDITNPKLGATQFSTYMGATNGCEAWSVWLGGFAAGNYGYGISFLLMSLFSLTGLIFLRKIKLKKS